MADPPKWVTSFMDSPQMLKIFVLYICRSRFIGSIFIPEHWTHLSMMPRSWNIWWPKMRNVNCLRSEPGLQWQVMVQLFQEIPNIFIISIEKLWTIVKMVCIAFMYYVCAKFGLKWNDNSYFLIKNSSFFGHSEIC